MFLRNLLMTSVIGAAMSFSVTAQAVLITADWQSAGDGLLIRDTATGLDWLKLTETNGISYNDVSSQLGAGGTYTGLRYASPEEVINIYANNFSIDLNLTDPSPTPIWGYQDPNVILAAEAFGDIFNEYSASYQGVLGLTSSVLNAGSHDTYGAFITNNYTKYDHEGGFVNFDNQAFTQVGSYLVTASPVPVPAAIWLLGTGLLGLFGATRRKSTPA